MNVVLGFDFAKSTGIALWVNGKLDRASQVKLCGTGGLMFLEFQEMVRKELHQVRREVSSNGRLYDPDTNLVVAYEKARRHMGVQQAHLAGAWEAILLMEVHTFNSIPPSTQARLETRPWYGSPRFVVHQVEVHMVKKLAAGRTDARKEEVVASAIRRWPHLTFSIAASGKKKNPTMLHDAADAAFVALQAATELGWS